METNSKPNPLMGLAVNIVMFFIAAFILMLAWNAVIPSIVPVRYLDFQGALPLLVTARVVGMALIRPQPAKGA